jgi:hypothetical protein
MSQLAKAGTSLKELREKAAMALLQKAGIDSDKAMRDPGVAFISITPQASLNL